MPVIPAGSINTTALTVPDLYVQIVPPQPLLNGVPSNIIGVVGVASWGPLNTPIPFGTYPEYQSYFGNLLNATFDMGTAVAICTQQGANSFVGVRVSDGTDVAASYVQGSTDCTFTARYTGTTGNSITITLAAGGASSSWNLTIGLPGVLTETFTNITGAGNTFWLNVASAINTGQGALRGPSQLLSAVAGTGTDAPAAGTHTLTSGTNGVTSVTSALLVGSNAIPRSGMYCLVKQNASIMLLADCTDTTQWSVAASFAESIGAYAVFPIVASESIAAAITLIQALGLNNSWGKIMHGDWLYWYDQVNQLTRLVSPASFAAGIMGALDPSQSTLNKQLTGVIGSQTAGLINSPQQYTYSFADLSTLFSAGIDVICHPAPGGPYWAVRGGLNSNLNAAQNGDNYTRMTNYIAATLAAGMGIFVGDKITASMDQSAVSTIYSFLSTLQQQGLLGDNNGPLPAIVQGGLGVGTPNPPTRTGAGYYQINVAITYSPINRFFIVNLQGGQTVVTSQSLQSPTV